MMLTGLLFLIWKSTISVMGPSISVSYYNSSDGEKKTAERSFFKTENNLHIAEWWDAK